MKKSTLLVFAFCVLVIASCKKNSGSGTLIGTWALTNVSGTSSDNYTAATGESTTYVYNKDSSMLTETTYYPALSSQTVANIKVVSELWTFNSDSTFTANETYINNPATGNGTSTSDSSGKWAYTSKAHNGFVLLSGYPFILTNVTNTNEYTIQSVTGTTLQLTVINSAVNPLGNSVTSNVTLTFTRQQ